MLTIFRNPEGLKTNEVVDTFKDTIMSYECFSKDEITQLAENFSKFPTDVFIISDEEMLEDTFADQGDILIWKEGSQMYESEFPLITELKPTDRLVLQDGDSMTGDHRVIPLEGSTYTMQIGKFIPSLLREAKFAIPSRAEYTCRVLTIDKPFLIFHREHGNIALPAGKYMICSQLDPATLTRMLD